MSKTISKTILIFVVVAVSLLVVSPLIATLCIRYSEYKERWLPCEQLGTYWSTEDGHVSFSVPTSADEPIVGALRLGEEEKIIQLFMGGITWGVDVTYKLYDKEDVIYPDEFWDAKKVQKDTFVVAVRDSDYFEEGEVLVFHKIGEKSAACASATAVTP